MTSYVHIHPSSWLHNTNAEPKDISLMQPKSPVTKSQLPLTSLLKLVGSGEKWEGRQLL